MSAFTVSLMNSKLGWGRAKISQPPAASTDDMPCASVKNARTSSVCGRNRLHALQ